MSLFITPSVLRPNRLEDEKNEKYHSDFAKWCLNSMNHPLYRKFVAKTLVNWSFFKGNDGQWIFDEDLESFFLDESGDVRNRLKMTRNLILPIVSQYVGNAIRLSYNARAKSDSDFIINRREEELARLKYFSNVAKNNTDLKKAITDRFPIGENEAETEEIFENSWVETHETDINNLLKWIESRIDTEEIKVQLAQQLALSGLCVYKGKEHNLEYEGEALNSLFYFWDMSAVKPDFSDAEYMGDWYYSDAASVFERYQNLSSDKRKAIEKYVTGNTPNMNGMNNILNASFYQSNSKIPMYEVYWRDIEVQEYGWVLDRFGYQMFTEINGEDGRYTDKDLIDPPKLEVKSPIAEGEKKTKIYNDVLRYCVFTPAECIEFKGEDIVYEHGIVPYGEKYLFSPSNIKFPYKQYALFYDKGDILSPIDNIISPQRFINRLISVAESQINNSRGSGTIIAKDAVDPRDGEGEVLRSMNKSKPVFVDTTRTGSVQNSVGTYGNNMNQGVLSLFDVVSTISQGIQEVTGVNESMTGTQGASDKLVGVVEAQIQRGSLLQEPFYWALSSVMKQAYQHMATVGKRIYYDNPRRLSIAVGDLGMQRILISEDTLLDDYRIFIERVEDEPTAKEKGNQLLWSLLQVGMIGEDNFKTLLNRATPDMVSDALREEVKLKKLQEMEQAKIEPAAQQQAASMEQAQMGMQQQAEDKKLGFEAEQRGMDREAKLAEAVIKSSAKAPQQPQQ